MLQKLKLSIAAVMALGLFAAPLALLPATAGAADIQQGLCQGAELDVQNAGNPSGGCAKAGNAGKSFNELLTQVINIISVIVGVVAVIMIIFGGFKYITSGGDSGNVSGAKNTILYAIIGLVIVALAQFIVRFVLNQTDKIV